MPRIPYLTDTEADAAAPGVAGAMRARRGGALIELDRILLHSPPVAEGWNAFFGQLRGNRLELSPRWRELAMCTVAVLNGAAYELHQHAPLYRAAGGTQAQLDALERLAEAPAQVLADPCFDDPSRAVLAAVWQSTTRVRIDDDTFAAARAALGGDRALFELLAVTAAYNMVSRVLVAFDVQPKG